MIRNRIRSLRSLAVPALAAALVGFAAPAALAEDDDPPIAAEEAQRVKASLEAKGYTDVHDLEIDDGRYEADARNADGHSVDLELDLKTLEILHEKRD